MKKLFLGATAILAITSLTAPAMADTVANVTYSSHLGAIGFLLGQGSEYSELGGVAGDTDTATPTVTNTFTLNGNVSHDCSYYGGGTTAHTINLGTIGVRTGDNENVSNAFEMVSPVLLNINSATAGCNFNNTVTITKTNGTSGLVDQSASGFDNSQFQNTIPYSVTALWSGTQNTSTGAGASGQSLAVGTGQASNQWTGGAWRSNFNMTIYAPTPSKALVAGNYTDTVTVTLAAS